MNSNDLGKFREDWLKELNNRSKEADNDIPLIGASTRGRNGFHRDEEPCVSKSDLEKQGDEGFRFCERKHLNTATKSKYRDNEEDKNPFRKNKRAKKEEEEDLLEILIADIDELTSLPFFDLELPREVAVNIFSYLDVRDLGSCACVNKKWKILSEDDLLWFQLCRVQGYANEEDCPLDREGWKEIFKDKARNRRCFEQNWKQRICQISELEYEKGGILYAASVSNNSIAAGYANGLVKLWNIFSESPTASFGVLLSETEQGRDSAITTVDANKSIAAAGYTNGDVKIWQNGLDFSLVESFNLNNGIDQINVADKSASVVTASGKKFRIDSANDNGQWRTLFQKDLNQNIRSVYIYDGDSCPCMIHTRNCVQLYGKDGATHQLESLVDSMSAEISAVSCTDEVISLGITPLNYSILDGYRIKTFSPEDGYLNRIMKGPNCRISCLAPPCLKLNLFAAGCQSRKIRVHDSRSENPVMVLKGLSAEPCSLQIDEWKVVAGDVKGLVSVWDQRTQSLLWQTAMRHPVRICHCVGSCLVCVSLPADRNPKETLWYMDDLIQHRRHRGTIRIFDFAADNNTAGIPEICQSNYDNYAGFNYNINLTTPYDIIDT